MPYFGFTILWSTLSSQDAPLHNTEYDCKKTNSSYGPERYIENNSYMLQTSKERAYNFKMARDVTNFPFFSKLK